MNADFREEVIPARLFPNGTSPQPSKETTAVRMTLKFPCIRAAVFASVLAVGSSGCATATREPANLSPHKQQVRAYVESGDYMRDLDRVAARAKAWVEERAARGGEKLTVIFDLDETLLFNWPHISAMDFGYVPSAWDNW